MMKPYSLREELVNLDRLGVKVGVKIRPNDDKGFDAKVAALASPDLEPAEDGLVLKSPNDTPRNFSLVVTAPIRPDLAVVIVDGKQSQAVNPQKPVREENGIGSFVRNFGTASVYGGHSTKPNNNSLRVVSVRDGLLEIISLGVVTCLYRRQEKGAYDFLVVQAMYRAQLFRQGEEIVAAGREIITDEAEYAGFNRWPAMRTLVNQMIPDKSVLPVFTLAAKAAAEVSDLEDFQGRVRFFDVRRRFGFADTINGPRYFNWYEDDSGNRLSFFKAGQIIQFSGVRATAYGEQLVGVKVA